MSKHEDRRPEPPKKAPIDADLAGAQYTAIREAMLSQLTQAHRQIADLTAMNAGLGHELQAVKALTEKLKAQLAEMASKIATPEVTKKSETPITDAIKAVLEKEKRDAKKA